MRMAVLAGLAIALCACGSSRTLISKPGSVPAGLDLSGNWVLTGTTGTNQRQARELLVYAFFVSGKSLKITQTDSGLFLSFDRSVVEEYRFGENREVSIGPANAQRASGWDAGGYIVETLDDDDALLTESYRLQNDRQQLRRTAVIVSRGRELLDLEMLYERRKE